MLARSRATAFDEAGNPDPMITPLDQLALQVRLFSPARLCEAAVQSRRIVAAVTRGVAEAIVRPHGGQGVRHLAERNQIAAPQLDPVDAKIARGDVEHPLHEETTFE